MRILVTGATGFIGRFLIRRLREDGHDVYGLVRKTSDISGLIRLGARCVRGDLTDIDSLTAAVEDKDTIYHLAVARLPRDVGTYYAVNASGTKNLILACHEKNRSIKRFVYVSSLAAAGYSPDGIPLRETAFPHPVTHYGRSKLLGEQAVLSCQDRIPVVILRPPTIVGPENLFFGRILSLIRRGIRPRWTGYTSLCGLDDFIESLLLAAEHAKAVSQTYFVCDGRRYAWDEIVAGIASHCQARTISVPLPRLLMRAAIPLFWAAGTILRKAYLANKLIELSYPYWLCDPAKIREQLGFQCRQDFRSALGDRPAQRTS